MEHDRFEVQLPTWLRDECSGPEPDFCATEDRMRFAISLSRLSVMNGLGGPFGAAVFEADSNRLVSVGVNLVVASSCSMMHAEVVALVFAQKVLGSHDLGAIGEFELVSSTEPCAMCFGAIHWSGISQLVCGAREQDARSVGFDEGSKPEDWVDALRQRGVSVSQDVCRDEATAVLGMYVREGGEIYNAGRKT